MAKPLRVEYPGTYESEERKSALDSSLEVKMGSDPIFTPLVKMNLVNQPAIPFQLPDASGQMHHRLSDYIGSWLLMVFHRHLG